MSGVPGQRRPQVEMWSIPEIRMMPPGGFDPTLHFQTNSSQSKYRQWILLEGVGLPDAVLWVARNEIDGAPVSGWVVFVDFPGLMMPSNLINIMVGRLGESS